MYSSGFIGAVYGNSRINTNLPLVDIAIEILN